MRKGFTLVEALIVIAILGIVASVILIHPAKYGPATGTALYSSEKTVVFPEATGYITDTINSLTQQDKDYMGNTAMFMDSKAQIAVCIIDTTGNLSIEDYSIKLAEKWQVGYRNKDNGIILLVAKNDRKLRIEVGRGLEGIITDAKASDIISNVITPYFKSGQFSTGVRAGFDAIVKEIGR